MELPELSTLIPSAGVFGLLAWLIVHFVRQGGADRSQYTTQITELRESHDKQIGSLIARHEKLEADLRAQITDLREAHDKQNTALRTEIDKLRNDLEVERQARWKAEDTAAAWRRRVEGMADDQGT
ncbi:MAG: hypothetical protein GEU78_09695 [Actinobacteria bacterium]|nr:hypothetical protein [Actinomycetota bacterium]